MRSNFLTLIVILFSLGSVGYAAPPAVCGFIEDPPEVLDISISVEKLRCEAVTDNPMNTGKPLTTDQLNLARRQLLKPYSQNTLWGAMQINQVNKLVDCMIVDGNVQHCTCLSTSLPVFLTYGEYGQFLLNSSLMESMAKEQGLNPIDVKTLGEQSQRAREKCAPFSQPKPMR